MELSRNFELRERRQCRGTSGDCFSAKAKVANEPQCRPAFSVQHRGVTFNALNRRFAVDLSGARGATSEKRSPINSHGCKSTT